MEEDSHLTFVFDNTHSWVRGKTINFTIHVHPKMSPSERKQFLTLESGRIAQVKKLVEQKILSTEAQLKQERKNLEELQANLSSVLEELNGGPTKPVGA